MEERIMQILQQLYDDIVSDEAAPDEEPWPMPPERLREGLNQYE